jgi:hypothetical protein
MNLSQRRFTDSKSASKPISGNGSRTTCWTPEHVLVSAEASSAASVSLARHSPSKPPRRKNSSAPSSKLKMGSDFSPLPAPARRPSAGRHRPERSTRRFPAAFFRAPFHFRSTDPLLSARPRPRPSGSRAGRGYHVTLCHHAGKLPLGVGENKWTEWCTESSERCSGPRHERAPTVA